MSARIGLLGVIALGVVACSGPDDDHPPPLRGGRANRPDGAAASVGAGAVDPGDGPGAQGAGGDPGPVASTGFGGSVGVGGAGDGGAPGAGGSLGIGGGPVLGSASGAGGGL